MLSGVIIEEDRPLTGQNTQRIHAVEGGVVPVARGETLDPVEAIEGGQKGDG